MSNPDGHPLTDPSEPAPATSDPTKPTSATSDRRLGVLSGIVVLLVAAAFAAGFAVGHHARSAAGGRDFMFQALGVHSDNQGGRTLNLYVHYRYNPGIAEQDLPNYLHMRRDALTYLSTTDLSHSPFWETLNHELCSRLKAGYPVEAISCELQVVSDEQPGQNEPGTHGSTETIGDIDPLAIPGPAA